MPEQREYSPLRTEVVTHLRTIAGRGEVLMTDPRHGAIHGTSIETMKDMIGTGVIRGFTGKSNSFEW